MNVPELHEVNCPSELQKSVEDYIAKYPDRHSASIPALRAAQEHYGWCSPEAIRAVAAVMRVSPAYLESVASFYDMLKLEPVGTHKLVVCTNLSCMMRGADERLAEFEKATGAKRGGTSEDGFFELEGAECMGACDIAPMASIDGKYRGPLEPGDAETVVEQVRADKEPLPDKSFVGDFGRKAAR